MANFRFDELMKDLGLPGGQGRDSAPTDEARGDSISTGRPDLAGSGLGEAVAPLPEADAAQILPL